MLGSRNLSLNLAGDDDDQFVWKPWSYTNPPFSPFLNYHLNPVTAMWLIIIDFTQMGSSLFLPIIPVTQLTFCHLSEDLDYQFPGMAYSPVLHEYL